MHKGPIGTIGLGLLGSLVAANFVEFHLHTPRIGHSIFYSSPKCFVYLQDDSFDVQKCFLISDDHDLLNGKNIVRTNSGLPLKPEKAWTQLELLCGADKSVKYIAAKSLGVEVDNAGYIRTILFLVFMIASVLHLRT
jgi:hypothetical protein